jgi:hypothetical protein
LLMVSSSSRALCSHHIIKTVVKFNGCVMTVAVEHPHKLKCVCFSFVCFPYCCIHCFVLSVLEPCGSLMYYITAFDRACRSFQVTI